MMASKLLEAARRRAAASSLSRPHLRSPAAALPAPPPPHARTAGRSRCSSWPASWSQPPSCTSRARRSWRPRRTRASSSISSRRRRPANLDYLEQATQRAPQGVRDRAGEGARLHHQRPRQQRAPGHRRHPVQAVGGEEAHAEADPAEPAAEGGRHRRRPGDLLRAAVAAGLDRRAAGAVRDHHDGRLFPAGAGAGRGAGGSRQERPLHLHRQRPQVRDAAGRAQARSRQGQPPRHHHVGHRRVAGHAARRQLRQPLQSLRPQLPGHSPGAARFPPHRRLAAALPGAHHRRRAGAAVEHRHGRAVDPAQRA